MLADRGRELGQRVLVVRQPRLRRIRQDLADRHFAHLGLGGARLDERHDPGAEIRRLRLVEQPVDVLAECGLLVSQAGSPPGPGRGTRAPPMSSSRTR